MALLDARYRNFQSYREALQTRLGVLLSAEIFHYLFGLEDEFGFAEVAGQRLHDPIGTRDITQPVLDELKARVKAEFRGRIPRKWARLAVEAFFEQLEERLGNRPDVRMFRLTLNWDVYGKN